jgi:hypothetical protein
MLPTPLELIPLERGLIAFRAGTMFLSAIPDGRVTLSAPRCSTWELFLASEDWCSDALAADDAQTSDIFRASFDKKRIESYIIPPLIRVWANTLDFRIYEMVAWARLLRFNKASVPARLHCRHTRLAG